MKSIQAHKNGIDDLSFVTVSSLPTSTTTGPDSSIELLWARLQELQRMEMKELMEERDKLQREKDTMNALDSKKKNSDGNGNDDDGDTDDIVEINVGGKVFLQVLRSTLCLAPDTVGGVSDSRR